MEFKRRERTGTGLLNHPEHAFFVANIIARWNLLEALWIEIFAGLIGHSYSVVLSRQMLGALQNIKAKLDVIEAAGKFTLEKSEHLKPFTKLLNECRLILRFRNDYAHGVFGSDERGELILINLEFDPVAWVLEHPDLDPSRCQEDRRPVKLTELKNNLSRSEDAYRQVFQFSQVLLPDLEHIAPWTYRFGPQARIVDSGPVSKRPPWIEEPKPPHPTSEE